MAFENKEVLHAVLEVCEPNASARSSCMELSGLPLEYVFKANEKLNYMSRFIPLLMEHHINLRQESIKKSIPVNLKPNLDFVMSSDLNWFIDFNFRLSYLFEKQTYMKNIINLSVETEYMKTCFDKPYEYWYQSALKAVLHLSREYEFKAPWYAEAEKAVSYHEEYLLPALNFLSSGVTMEKDPPDKVVDTWLDLFNLFVTID